MVSVYSTNLGWFCASADTVTFHRNLRDAMDAAYRQTNRDGATTASHPNSNDR